MRTQLYHSTLETLALLSLALLIPLSAAAQFKDQHSVEAIVVALKSPISPQAVKEARDLDDDLMAEGRTKEGKVYLVTDERSTRASALVRKLLDAMDEDPSHWVVRVLDTDPPIANAFVMGGKYIYVFTGLIKEAASDDELAFFLSHEIGHSLLKHIERRKGDTTSIVAGGAVILGQILKKKHRKKLEDVAKAVTASYSRTDEEEADTIAVAIARRGGYDPLRGADFFSRSKRQQDKTQQETQQDLEQMCQQAQNSQNTCQEWLDWYKSSRWNQTRGNANKVNAICRDAESKRLRCNQTVQQYDSEMQEQQRDLFFRTHPQDQNRIAAIVALTDYMYKRRDLQSLAKYQQSYRVMLALQQVDSVLLNPPGKTEALSSPAVDPTPKTTTPSLAEQLSDLKRAHDQGLITGEEYERKRQQILDRY